MSGVPVSLLVMSENGNIVTVEQLDVDADKTFSAELAAGGQLWKTGTYTIKAQYGSPNRSATTMFEFGAAAMPAPGPGSEPGAPGGQEMQTYRLSVEDLGTFDIGYSITGGSISSITADDGSNSVTVQIDATDDGELMLALPRDVIDARMDGCDGADEDFIVLVDLEERDFEESKTSDARTLTIGFEAGAEEIEIVGTCAVPEFGAVAVLILAAAVIALVAMSARSRLGVAMPKY